MKWFCSIKDEPSPPFRFIATQKSASGVGHRRRFYWQMRLLFNLRVHFLHRGHFLYRVGIEGHCGSETAVQRGVVVHFVLQGAAANQLESSIA